MFIGLVDGVAMECEKSVNADATDRLNRIYVLRQTTIRPTQWRMDDRRYESSGASCGE
jgi:hypothetical protein